MTLRRTEVIMEAVLTKIKAVLNEFEDVLESEVTPENAEILNKALAEASRAGWTEGIRAWLKEAESSKDVLEVDGKVYRFKFVSEKEFLTPGGILKLERRVYQQDKGGKCHVPIDAAWGMVDEFATVEVRDAVLYATALGTPREAEELMKKCSLCQPSATAIKNMVTEMGVWLEAHEDEALEAIRADEDIPEETRVLCVSLDGVNVLLSEPGKKKGRPHERPHEDHATDKESPTCYKNAMVGAISLYGEVPEDGKCPQRLVSRYAARMPEDRALTLKAKLEAELQQLESQLDDNTARIVLCDGARSLWSYIEESVQYDDYEKLIDYHHATEHLSKAAESIFGKGSDKAQRWYDKMRFKLKTEDEGVASVLRSINYYLRTAKLSAARRQAVRTERTYFSRNRRFMEYARFRRNGWPIGSGPVEAACKSLVKARLCRSGMRWSRRGGQHVLSLRTLVKSGRWDQMWREFKRMTRAASPAVVT